MDMVRGNAEAIDRYLCGARGTLSVAAAVATIAGHQKKRNDSQYQCWFYVFHNHHLSAYRVCFPLYLIIHNAGCHIKMASQCRLLPRAERGLVCGPGWQFASCQP